MAVVINEFEVVAEAPKAAEVPAAPGGNEAPPAPSTPRDIERIMRRQLERFERVWAH